MKSCPVVIAGRAPHHQQTSRLMPLRLCLTSAVTYRPRIVSSCFSRNAIRAQARQPSSTAGAQDLHPAPRALGVLFVRPGSHSTVRYDALPPSRYHCAPYPGRWSPSAGLSAMTFRARRSVKGTLSPRSCGVKKSFDRKVRRRRFRPVGQYARDLNGGPAIDIGPGPRAEGAAPVGQRVVATYLRVGPRRYSFAYV